MYDIHLYYTIIPRTVIDDVTYCVAHRIFNTNSSASMTLEIDRKLASLMGFSAIY